jgi:hypothetical protein
VFNGDSPECGLIALVGGMTSQVSGEGDDKYLIATAEQPICALHREKWIIFVCYLCGTDIMVCLKFLVDCYLLNYTCCWTLCE